MTEIHDIKRFINLTIRNTNRFPSLRDICSSLSFTEDQATKCMEALAEDGYIEKVGSWYKFPDESESTDWSKFDNLATTVNPHTQIYDINGEIKRKRGRPVGSTKKVVEPHQAAPEASREVVNAKEYQVQIKIIQAVMAFIGSGAAIISVYYTSIWMIEFLPLFLAMLLSIIMVGFSVFAFEVIIIFMTDQITENKFIKISAVSGLTILWVIATFFSLSSTVAGQVNSDLYKKEQKINSIDYNGKAQWQILQDQKNELKEQLETYKQQSSTYNQILSGINTAQLRKENKGAWNDANYKLSSTQKNISKIVMEIEDVRNQEKILLQKNKNVVSGEQGQAPDFYLWISKVLGIGADKIQFLLALFPAIFVDCIAPVALAIALFLKNKN